MRKKKPARHIHHTTNRLRILRAGRKWSQSEVARRLGHPSKFRFWQIENEEAIPSDKERRQLARMFGVRDREIFPNLTALTSVAA